MKVFRTKFEKLSDYFETFKSDVEPNSKVNQIMNLNKNYCKSKGLIHETRYFNIEKTFDSVCLSIFLF